MKGLKIIPLFAVLLFLSYIGVMFVRANPEDVVVRFGSRTTPSTALGFVILTSALAGMIFAGILCSIELIVLYMQNQRMKRKLYPRGTPPSSGLLSSVLGKKLDTDDDLDELTREEGEPKREDHTGSSNL